MDLRKIIDDWLGDSMFNSGIGPGGRGRLSLLLCVAQWLLWLMFFFEL